MKTRKHFNRAARSLHWLMAIALFAMLVSGVVMVTSLQYHAALLDWHRPLGIVILGLVMVRFINRLRNPPPALPTDLPRWQVIAAHASHWALYTLMFVLPLIGWAMLSAAGYPIRMTDSFYLPTIIPQSTTAYGILRPLHGLLAYLFFLAILGHLAAALYHAWVRRDGVFSQMALSPKNTDDLERRRS